MDDSRQVQEILFCLKHLDLLWRSPCFLFSGYRISFPSVR